MKGYLRLLLIPAVLLSGVLFLSGCGHHSQREVAGWFQEQIADEKIAVSKDYMERENEEGYTDRVWTAYLRDLPEVEFELISHHYYSLFSQYSIETTYHLEMGQYYRARYEEEHPHALGNIKAGETDDGQYLTLDGLYDTLGESAELAGQIGRFEAYIAGQEYPCIVEYSLAFREPQTYIENSPVEHPFQRETQVTATGGERDPDRKSVGEILKAGSEKAFAGYALVYRLEMEQFTEEQLEAAAAWHSDFRFTITRPDGMEICYPQLLLCNMDSLSFGGLYEVLQREGGFQVNGTPEEFSFTAADGRELSFSYAYREELEAAGEVFYYMQDGEKVPLSYIPELESAQCHALTGLSFERLK